MKNEKRCRNGVKKVHKQGRIKVMVNIQSLIHPYIFSQKSKDVGTRLWIFTITSILPCCVLFGAPFLHFISFLMIFLSCFCTFWQCSHLRCEINTTLLITTLYLKTVLTGEYVSNCSVSPSMQPHAGSLDTRSLVAYTPCFYAPDFHSSF